MKAAMEFLTNVMFALKGLRKEKDPAMRKRRILIWMMRKGLNQKDLARKYGVSRAAFSLTINGKRQTAKVIAALRAEGCPASYLPAA